MTPPNIRKLELRRPNGAALLEQLRDRIADYVVLPSEHDLVAVTLWAAATHLQSAHQHAPRLAIISPEKRCGKSRLLDVLDAVCHDPLITANATPAAIFRSIGQEEDPPTLLHDEADAVFGNKRVAEANEDLRALYNAGFQRDRGVRRTVGPQHAVANFETFAMAALAAIR